MHVPRNALYVVSNSVDYMLVFLIVRHKVKELVALVQDDEALRAERKKAKKNKDKYIGMSGGRSGQFYS